MLYRVLTVFLILALTTGAGVYRWTDAEGNVHFGSTPPRVKDNIQDLDRYGESDVNLSLNELIPGDWFGMDDKAQIELKITRSDQGRDVYIWRRDQGRSHETLHSGYVRYGNTILTLVDADGQIQHQFDARTQSRYQLVLTDKVTDQQHRFRRPELDRTDLNAREQMLSGIWTELSLEHPDRPLFAIEFKGGQFTRYQAHTRFGRYQPPRTNLRTTLGDWRVDGNTLSLDYLRAYGPFSQYSMTTQYWEIIKLEPRELVLRQQDGNAQLHFRRQP